MATKAIIEVDLDQSKFDAFKKLFDEHLKDVQSLGGEWLDADKAIKKVNKDFDTMTEAVTSLAVTQAKITVNADKFDRSTKESNKSMKSLSAQTKDVANNILNATTSLLKWAGITGVIGGLIGAGGLFGIDRLAEGIGSRGIAAARRGDQPGQETAFDRYFSRYADTNTLMNAAFTAKSDVTSPEYSAMLRAGLGGSLKKDPAELAMDVLRNARALAQKTPQAFLGPMLQTFGYDRLGVSAGSAYQMAHTSDKDFEEQFRKERNAEKADAISQKSSMVWQSLVEQLGAAADKIKAVLGNSLVGLAGPIGKLSDAVANAIKEVFKGPQMAGWIDSLSVSIKQFADYLKSPDFKDDLDDFMDGIEDVAHKLKLVFGLGSREEVFSEYGDYIQRKKFVLAGTDLLNKYYKGVRHIAQDDAHLGLMQIHKSILPSIFVNPDDASFRDKLDPEYNAKLFNAAFTMEMFKFKHNRAEALAAVYSGEKQVRSEIDKRGIFHPSPVEVQILLPAGYNLAATGNSTAAINR